MTTATDVRQHYTETFARFEKSAAGAEHAWLRPIREAAIARFEELGIPSTKDEDWKFTNLAPLAKTAFRLTEDGAVEVSARDLTPFAFPGTNCSRLVFVNGRYAPGLSSIRPLPEGTRISNLADALTSDRDVLEQYLAQYADYHNEPFTALNTAFMQDGGFVYIPRNAVLEEPIHLLYVSTASATPTVTHPRNLILAEENAQATVIEDYVGLGDAVYFSNAVTEVVAGENAVLSHSLIERESPGAFNISTLRVEQRRSSNVSSHTTLLGGRLVRNNIHPVLAGEGGTCLINGLFMPTAEQHMDNFMKVEHASPHCNSRQYYNGILDGHGHGVFSGRIIVHKDAQKTDAKQENRNLLLSEHALVDTNPQLEIYADDVKCTHGATIGQIDQDAVFYLRSRGIPEERARALLLFAFAAESLGRMKVRPIRKYLEALVRHRLPHGMLLEEAR